MTLSVPHGCVFLYSARTQFSNAGDALINRELLKLVRAHGSIVAIKGGADGAFIDQVQLQPDEVIDGGEFALLVHGIRRRLKGDRVYLLGTPGDVGGAISARTLLFRSIMAPLVAAFGIKAVRVGASLGHSAPMLTRLLAWESRFASGLGLRDPISRGIAIDAGFRKVLPFPDLAFALPMSARSADLAWRTAAVCFRSDQLDEPEAAELATIIRQTIARAKPDKVLIFVQVLRDQAFAERLASELERPVEIVASLSIDDLLVRYSEVDLLLTNRLHGFLMGWVSGAFPVAILDRDKNRKIVGILEGLGLHGLVFTPSSPPDPDVLQSTGVQQLADLKTVADAQRRALPVGLAVALDGV